MAYVNKSSDKNENSQNQIPDSNDLVFYKEQSGTRNELTEEWKHDQDFIDRSAAAYEYITNKDLFAQKVNTLLLLLLFSAFCYWQYIINSKFDNTSTTYTPYEYVLNESETTNNNIEANNSLITKGLITNYERRTQASNISKASKKLQEAAVLDKVNNSDISSKILNNHYNPIPLIKNDLKMIASIKNKNDLSGKLLSGINIATINSFKGKEIQLWSSIVTEHSKAIIKINKGMNFFISSPDTIRSIKFNDFTRKSDEITSLNTISLNNSCKSLIDKYPAGALLYRLNEKDEWTVYSNSTNSTIADKDGILELRINLKDSFIRNALSVTVSTGQLAGEY